MINENLVLLVLAVMIKKSGGKVKITQNDIDEVAHNSMLETRTPEGDMEIELLSERLVS